MKNIFVELNAGLTVRLAYLPEQQCNKASHTTEPPCLLLSSVLALLAEEPEASLTGESSARSSKQSSAGLALLA